MGYFQFNCLVYKYIMKVWQCLSYQEQAGVMSSNVVCAIKIIESREAGSREIFCLKISKLLELLKVLLIVD